MTINEFVRNLWENDQVGAYAEPMDIETAKTDLANYAADGWTLPEGITPEAYMEAWNELIPKKEYFIQFEAGTNESGEGINYMVCIDNPALYAELKVPDGDIDEEYGYFTLKNKILRQAEKLGISADQLKFWWDGQERFLSPQAHAE